MKEPVATLKLALIGHPIVRSLSPAMHRSAMAYLRRKGSYELIDCFPEELEAVVSKLRSEFTGFNVTVPHKQSIMSLVDSLTEDAQVVQAVNTVLVLPGGKLLGHNTDSAGFLNSLFNKVDLKSFRLPCVCILGSGGAARAALWAVTVAGAEQVVIVARNCAEARKMRDDIARTSVSNMEIVVRSTGEPLNSPPPALIINCTPAAVCEDQIPDWIQAVFEASKRSDWPPMFFDMAYSPTGEGTRLVNFAKQRGLLSCDGTPMLLEQAILAFEFWTGVKVPAGVMAEAILEQTSSNRASQ